MILNEVTHKTKCDFAGCKNLAEICFADENDTKKKICLCKNCASEIYVILAKQNTPKGIEAPFKKQKKLR